MSYDVGVTRYIIGYDVGVTRYIIHVWASNKGYGYVDELVDQMFFGPWDDPNEAVENFEAGVDTLRNAMMMERGDEDAEIIGWWIQNGGSELIQLHGLETS